MTGQILKGLHRRADPRQGMSGEDVRTYCAVINKVKAAGLAPCVLLEEADYEALIRKLDAYRGWSRAHDNVVTFMDDLKKAEKVEIAEVKPPKTARPKAVVVSDQSEADATQQIVVQRRSSSRVANPQPEPRGRLRVAGRAEERVSRGSSPVRAGVENHPARALDNSQLPSTSVE